MGRNLFVYLNDSDILFIQQMLTAEYLCIQAQYHSWIHASTVETHIKKSGHWTYIKNIIQQRISENVPYSLGKQLEDCLSVIQKLGY